MKKTFLLLLIVIGAFFTSDAQNKSISSKSSKKQTIPAKLVSYTIDNASTVVKWDCKKVGGSHNGRVSVLNGTLNTTSKAIVSGNVTIDMNTMTCDDIENAEYNAKLIGHLKNEDFFNTTQFPHASLNIGRISSIGKGMYKVTGKLTIKDQTHPIAFNMQINQTPDQITGNGKLIFDRTKFDVKYGSTLFGAAADKAIENNVTLDINLVANKKN